MLCRRDAAEEVGYFLYGHLKVIDVNGIFRNLNVRLVHFSLSSSNCEFVSTCLLHFIAAAGHLGHANSSSRARCDRSSTKPRFCACTADAVGTGYMRSPWSRGQPIHP